MQGVTLTISIIFSLLVLGLKPIYALSAYLSILIWYPDYLRVSLGTIDISVSRFVITILLLRCLCNAKIHNNFSWSRLDTFVTLSMVIYVGVYCISFPSFRMSLENRGGFVMDTWFVYLATRLCINSPKEMFSFIKFTAIVLVPLALLGVFEAVSGSYVFRALHRFCPWRSDVPILLGRWGFTRAHASFSHSIMFGDCFVIFLPLIWTLRHHRDHWKKLSYLLLGIALLGIWSSMSSGPWIMAVAAMCFMGMEKWRHNLKFLIVTLVMAALIVEIISNRHLYYVIPDYLNFTGGVWWQRAKLIDCAIEDFGKWWLTGYGGVDPGWGRNFYMDFTDVNNELILTGITYGIWGIIALCSVLIVAFQELILSSTKTISKELRSLYWAFGVILSATLVAWMGVSFFGQLNSIFYLILGLLGSSVLFPMGITANIHRARSINNLASVNR